ncbi:unnamed protein product [Prorocentrum cordatum]|uniref:Uncharacterized protein n=1 Tax=Prorocentrum cordatum TaxID=2364126 RepID=A0ABN9Q279_9DINO|nr:unnamed protein product [Polarella glacialis]
MQLLDLQFHHACLSVLGLQEGRALTLGRKDGVHSIMLCATGDGDQAGVQIWLAQDAQASLRAWNVADARLMWAAVAFPNGAAAIFSSAHAPTEASDDTTISSYFDKTQTLIHKVRANHATFEVIIFVDGNARLGSVPSQYVGNREVAVANMDGFVLRSVLEMNELFAVNTFYNAGPTWRHGSSGNQYRIDYSLSTRTARQGVSDFRVRRDLDLTFAGWIDHYLVSATVLLFPHPDTPQQPKKPKSPNICKWCMADPC